MLHILFEPLYHGTIVPFKRIDVSRGKGRRDFGRGFYMAVSAGRRMQGAEVFLNVYVFFLIIAGIILDKMGVRFTAVLSGAVMLVGGIIKFYACSESFIGTSMEAWFNTHLNWNVNIPFIGDILPFADGMPGSATAKSLLLQVLETENLGVQCHVGKQSVADRVVASMEEVDWRMMP